MLWLLLQTITINMQHFYRFLKAPAFAIMGFYYNMWYIQLLFIAKIRTDKLFLNYFGILP